MKNDEPLYLNEAQVRNHLRMKELIPAMEKALIDFSTGKVTQPVRSVITVDPPGGFYGMMPALTPEGLGQKIVTFYPPNAKLGIPTHMATIFLVDPQTGAPLAVMDGTLITEMRTAAVSAAAKDAPEMSAQSRITAPISLIPSIPILSPSVQDGRALCAPATVRATWALLSGVAGVVAQDVNPKAFPILYNLNRMPAGHQRVRT